MLKSAVRFGLFVLSTWILCVQAEMRYAYHFVNAEDGQVVLSQDADVLAPPASLVKLFTATLVAESLDLAQRPQTRYQLIKDTEDKWHLVIHGDGDPGFSSRYRDELFHFFDEVAQNVKKHTQTLESVILDVSQFAGPQRPKSWEAADLPHYYASPVSPLLFNDNCYELKILVKEGVIFIDLAPFDNSPFFTIPEFCLGPSFEASYKLESGQLQMDVTVPEKFHKTLYFCDPQPERLFFRAVSSRLEKQGISIIQPMTTKWPISGLLAENEQTRYQWVYAGETYRTLLKTCLQRSNNLFAEMLGRRAVFAISQQPATYQQVTKELVKIGKIASNHAFSGEFFDSCGLSRANQLSPRHVVQLLRHWQKHESLRALFDLLPEAAKSGSLRHRLKSFNGQILAKTGTLSGIQTLAGKIIPTEGSVLIFAIFGQKESGSATANRAELDRKLMELIRSISNQ